MAIYRQAYRSLLDVWGHNFPDARAAALASLPLEPGIEARVIEPLEEHDGR